MSNWRNLPGPGDPETWPACTGDPMDPRSPERPAFEDLTPEQQLDELCELYDARELAAMLQVAQLECDLLRARLRKAERNA